VPDYLILHGFVVFSAENINEKKAPIFMVFFNIVWSPLSSGPNKQRKGYIEGNRNDESDQNVQKNGE
jgi:hypothetical protein